MKAFVGNAADAIYSCSKLRVTGGDSSLKCNPQSLTAPSCIVASSPGAAEILAGSSAGRFCYNQAGTIGFDNDLAKVPVNIQCDPRVGCNGIAVAPFLCAADITTDILTPNVSPHAVCPNFPEPTQSPAASPAVSPAASPAVSPVASPVAPVPGVPAPSPTPVEVEDTEYECNNVIVSEACYPPTDPVTCSGAQVATCQGILFNSAFTNADGYIDGKYSFADCQEGFICAYENFLPKCLPGTCQAGTGIVPSVPAPPAESPAAPPVAESPAAEVPVESSPDVPEPPSSNCPSEYALIPEGTECDVETTPLTCSGNVVAQCAWKTRTLGNYFYLPCGPGTVCRKEGIAVFCDYEKC